MLTRREEFAKAAMQAVIHRDQNLPGTAGGNGRSPDAVAAAAVRYADALELLLGPAEIGPDGKRKLTTTPG